MQCTVQNIFIKQIKRSIPIPHPDLQTSKKSSGSHKVKHEDENCRLCSRTIQFTVYSLQFTASYRRTVQTDRYYLRGLSNLDPHRTSTRPDPTRPDPTRPDPTRPDPTRPDPTRPDPTGPPIFEKLIISKIINKIMFHVSSSSHISWPCSIRRSSAATATKEISISSVCPRGQSGDDRAAERCAFF